MRRAQTGTFEVGLPASEAISLFTPEGERPWAPGWDPHYAAGEMSESPGTAFTTAHRDVVTYWVILEIDRDSHSSSYVRITPGGLSGTVAVQCTDIIEGRSEATVTYDMTLLEGSDPAHMDHFEPGAYREMMKEWSTLVADYLAKT
jgi:hypothetical protein